VSAAPITQDVITGAPNGSGGTKTVSLAVNPTQEYVSGAGGTSASWYAHTLRAWPWSIDDLTADYGDDLYERMLHDAHIAASINVLKAAIIEDGLTVAPAVTEKAGTAADATLAATIADLAERMFAEMDTPLDEVLWDMLSAVALGNRIAEQVYAIQPFGGTLLLNLIALRVKPRQALAFVVDPFLRVQGLLAQLPGKPSPVSQGSIVNPALLPNILPRGKFAVLSFRPKNGDPRGTSVLRPAYTAWNLKGQAQIEHLKYLVQFASPSLIGTTPANATRTPVLDSAGNIVPGKTIDPIENLKEALLAFRNGSAFAGPYGTIVKELFSSGDGSAFLHAFDRYNQDITLAILGQTLATGEGQHDSRAAATVHQDILDTMVRQAKRAVVRMLTFDVLRPWVIANWGEAALPLVPALTLGTTEAPDLSALMLAVASLEKAAWFTPSQKPEVDLLLNLPQRTQQETDLETERFTAPPVSPTLPTGAPGGPQDATSGTGNQTDQQQEAA
jgi:hypothetical protein